MESGRGHPEQTRTLRHSKCSRPSGAPWRGFTGRYASPVALAVVIACAGVTASEASGYSVAVSGPHQ